MTHRIFPLAGDRPGAHAIVGALCVAALFGISGPVHAQETPSPAAEGTGSIDLSALQEAAVQADPRTMQFDALTTQTALRLENIEREWLPTPSVNVQAQYQSDVVHLPMAIPGVTGLQPQNDTYDGNITTRMELYDPTRDARAEVERANLGESQARVRSDLYGLRQEVNDAYFAALRADVQRREITASMTALEAQLEAARNRLQERAVLPGDVASLEAELLRQGESLGQLTAGRDAALAVLAGLTGRDVEFPDSLPVFDIAEEVAEVRATNTLPHTRPEYEQFDAIRETLRHQGEIIDARSLPNFGVIGRAGYGRPGLNPLASEFSTYWVAGLQLEWVPWNWGARGREREALAVQQEIVASAQAAFDLALERRVANDLATMDWLEQALADDDRIVALRERILDEARLRYEEAVLTSAEFVRVQTDLLSARLARVVHRVQLAEAGARYLTTLGIAIP